LRSLPLLGGAIWSAVADAFAPVKLINHALTSVDHESLAMDQQL
jgi:hypothetical protein